ncbi:N-acetyltransferase [Anaerotruncus massiliensis (ex Togo et al. 2019)]|uniref:N-acetyltransferase n=1 Tax=Anaerotruncus massiliensis (ex Togo et al. 2019) TaxID=1673720 RepID=UPI0027BA73DE|nr:N-acetyltransferase [Anaerotruncus massiliensis (ex Togo et al. 2019)]
MDGYVQVSLGDMIEQIGEGRVKSILSSFSCPMNPDIEYFLKHRAIEFAKQSMTPTHLIFSSYKDKLELIGYFSLTIKTFRVYKDRISRALCDKIKKFGVFDADQRVYMIPAPLIAQLGKNFSKGLDKLISGDELLQMAIDKIAMIQQSIGGKVVYVECEDKPKLLDFYRRNGFVRFGERRLDLDEKSRMYGTELIQLLKVVKRK